jgi:dipeptidyl aminopeptidase/acylaminoacyl peptidase
MLHTRTRRRLPRLLVLLLLATAAAACDGEDPTAPEPEVTPPPAGLIEVTVTTSGGTLDPDGYSVLVDGMSEGTIAIDGTLTVETGVGSHEVYLADNAFNCFVEQKAAVPVDVGEGQTSTVQLSVRCVTPILNSVLFTAPTAEGTVNIVRISANNPNVSQRLIVPDASHPSLSPDGTRVAFEREGRVYSMWVDGSDMTLLTPDGGHEPTWSPDGSRIAYSAEAPTGARLIYVMDSDGSNLDNLTAGPGDTRSPAWSPDGQRLVFVRSTSGGDAIVLKDLDIAGAETVVYSNPAELASPAWSPEGRFIAFVFGARSEQFLLLQPLVDGSEVLSLGRLGDVADPAWSPDGSRLAFVSTMGGPERKLWVTSISTYEPQRLFPNSRAAFDPELEPVYSPSSN